LFNGPGPGSDESRCFNDGPTYFDVPNGPSDFEDPCPLNGPGRFDGPDPRRFDGPAEKGMVWVVLEVLVDSTVQEGSIIRSRRG
jgi:hypothetical protein